MRFQGCDSGYVSLFFTRWCMERIYLKQIQEKNVEKMKKASIISLFDELHYKGEIFKENEKVRFLKQGLWRGVFVVNMVYLGVSEY